METILCNQKNQSNIGRFSKASLEDKKLVQSKNFSFIVKKNSSPIRKISFSDSNEDQSFVPKIKSKQLICNPKFFFSLERKKLKIQKSVPSFSEIEKRPNHTQLKKRKSQYIERIAFNKSALLFKNQRAKTIDSVKTSLQSSNNHAKQHQQWLNERKLSSYSSEIIRNHQCQGKKFRNNNNNFLNLHQNPENQKKKLKRPNLYENMSFLIKRRKEKQQKITLNKLNHSKNYMTEVVRNYDQY